MQAEQVHISGFGSGMALGNLVVPVGSHEQKSSSANPKRNVTSYLAYAVNHEIRRRSTHAPDRKGGQHHCGDESCELSLLSMMITFRRR